MCIRGSYVVLLYALLWHFCIISSRVSPVNIALSEKVEDVSTWIMYLPEENLILIWRFFWMASHFFLFHLISFPLRCHSCIALHVYWAQISDLIEFGYRRAFKEMLMMLCIVREPCFACDFISRNTILSLTCRYVAVQVFFCCFLFEHRQPLNSIRIETGERKSRMAEPPAISGLLNRIMAHNLSANVPHHTKIVAIRLGSLLCALQNRLMPSSFVFVVVCNVFVCDALWISNSILINYPSRAEVWIYLFAWCPVPFIRMCVCVWFSHRLP